MKKTILIALILLIFCLSIFAQENENVSVGTAISIGNRSNDEGEISGRLQEYNVYKKDYDFLKTLERPELTLVFKPNFRVEIENSENLVETLNSHWNDAIKFFHKSEIEKFSNALSQSSITFEWTEKNEANIENIQTVSIDAPGGKRNISQNEASGMITFLNTVAKNLIDEAKEFKGTFTGIKLKNKPQPRGGVVGCRERSGHVTLRVLFDKSATITNVEIISSSGCASFDKSSVKAAKRIKFKPAMIDGKPITVKKRIMYSYLSG